ncbi:AMP-binding protein [Ectothiorhodospiraceae bacterium 2226]|nr:AMP-binding protein [Ectothiorhodospiraceae bacterium 2226]
MNALKWLLRLLLTRLYRVELSGMEHYHAAGKRVLVVANHTSFLDALLLAVFLPDRLTFAVNTHVAARWWLRPLIRLVDAFPMDPTSPYATRALIRYLQEDRRAVIFPEGRITVTGSLMKIYDGTGMVADKSGATLLPVRIDGAQYTPFSRLRGRVRLRWFPRIRLAIQPPVRLEVPEEVRGRARRHHAGAALADVMTQMMFASSDYRRTLLEALLDARRVHGGRKRVVEDIQRRPLSYNAVLARAYALGRAMAPDARPGDTVGLMLPNATAAAVAFFALHIQGRVPAMLNYTLGARALASTCRTARVEVVYTSRRFVAAAKLDAAVQALAAHTTVIYLEDLAARLDPLDKLRAALFPYHARWHKRRARPDDPAVVLFTSGSEGAPKGVVLSHANLLANREQIAARIAFSAQDVILNALPVFHSFGLTAGTLLPLLSGMRTFFYPSPLHYRIVPEVAYDINATVLFGTNTFLKGYARHAHPYDFYSIRYVFAGAEKLQDETRRVWAEKFGIRVFEGYGATETSPVLSMNTPMDFLAGSTGRLLPGIEWRLEPVPGVSEGGRLAVRGPNVMLGHLLPERPGELVPPATAQGPGWYDLGDIVSVDERGFVHIRGRAKRFAKIGGEMVSLTTAEELAARTWPQAQHAVVSVPDANKGERLVLYTSQPDAARAELVARAQRDSLGEINVPKRVVVVPTIPVLGSGKTDYAKLQTLAEEAVA